MKWLGPALGLVWVLAACSPEPEVHGGDEPETVSGGPDVSARQPGACPAGVALGCVTAYSKKVCNDEGTEFEEQSCPAGQICITGGDGQSSCTSAVCLPDNQICLAPNRVGRCRADGSGYEPMEVCNVGLTCAEGQCVSACTAELKATTNVGCNYALVDLGNFESEPSSTSEDNPVVVVVSNTSGAADATIEITSSATGATLPLSAAERVVPPLQLRTFLLPVGFAQLDTSINRGSWFLSSDQPITVHLINPENGLHVRSNDATLLFPTDAVGNEYLVMGWKSFWTLAQGRDDLGYPKYGFESYVTVVATSSGTTTVTLQPTADVRAGTRYDGQPLKRVAKGETAVYQLQQGDVLNYATEPIVGEADLTGTSVVSDKAVAVFSAHNCAFVPNIDVPFCDHLEHQLAPVKTWRKSYAADMFQPRAEGAYDVWRVMAGQDQTVISTVPSVPGIDGVILDKGEWVEYQADISHLITASGRIQVGHFMTGSNFEGFTEACGDTVKTGIGDPAFTIGVALDQYLDSYIVLTPPGYSDDWLNIVRYVGEEVLLDGVPIIEQGEPIEGSLLEVVRVPVEDGVHRVDSDEPVGVTAYGYDCDVSYAYPGGMLLVPGS